MTQAKRKEDRANAKVRSAHRRIHYTIRYSMCVRPLHKLTYTRVSVRLPLTTSDTRGTARSFRQDFPVKHISVFSSLAVTPGLGPFRDNRFTDECYRVPIRMIVYNRVNSPAGRWRELFLNDTPLRGRLSRRGKERAMENQARSASNQESALYRQIHGEKNSVSVTELPVTFGNNRVQINNLTIEAEHWEKKVCYL